MPSRTVRRAQAAVFRILAAALLIFALLPASASAHAALLDSSPAPGARLAHGPAQVTLDFTEPLNGGLSTAKLLDADSGATIPTSVSSSQRELTVTPRVRLRKGAYRVDWHTVSTLDGHALEGSFGFGVQVVAGLGEGSVEQSPLARDGWLRIALRAGMYALLFFFAGGVINAAILAPRRRPGEWLVPASIAERLAASGEDRGPTAEGLWARTLSAGWLALALAIAAILAEAADAGGGLGLRSLGDYLLTNGAGLARIGTVAALGLAAVSANRLPRASAAWLAIAFGTIAFAGHANSADPRALAVLTDWLHLIAAAVWIGGIAQLALAWLPALRRVTAEVRRAVMSQVLARFGRVALPAFGVVVATGLTNALIQLGHPAALWETGYGRVLAVKIALVGAIAVASYLHALRLRPRILAANPHPPAGPERRHWRLLSLEPLLGLGAIVAVSALVAFPLPPHQLDTADEAAAATPCEASCPLPAARADQLPIADHVGPDIAALWLKPDGSTVDGTVRLLNVETKPVEGSIELPRGRVTTCGTGCWRISAPMNGAALTITAGESKRTLAVPTSWGGPGRNRTARRLLVRAQRSMRSLRTARLDESVTSGLGTAAGTRYRFRAPDRMAYTTNLGARLVAIGKTEWESTAGNGFEKRPFGADGFHFDQFFNWRIYGRSVRWLGAEGKFATIAIFDQGSPLWDQLTVDRRSDRVVRERLIAPGHFMTRRWHAFDRPERIVPPR